MEFEVKPLVVDQFFMAAGFDDAVLMQNNDSISRLGGGKTVSDDNAGSVLHKPG
jgi:hypothetical protein